MRADKLHLTIQSTTEQLSLVREFVSDAARHCGFDEESTGKIALAADEACTNVIKHAYEYMPNKKIDIRVRYGNGVFEIIITHQGKTFDPQAIKPPDMREYLTHYRRGGLGMHLMRSLMDRVEYKNLPDKRSEVHLVKKIPAKVGR